ncbi:protein of unknown function [Methylocaldum szegediense]|jgi:hypothetical protein|uniref:Methyltransferase type 11 domain-containing protein n=1 Tax=Methylocaldum szegediense TaxID=73780 RepID=A0ABM9I6K3_9GAMM|nr:protein of unknown function [Methylocaldum szegediense]
MANKLFEPTSSTWRNHRGYTECKVLEVGAGAGAPFDKDSLWTRRIGYTALDISPDEFAVDRTVFR